MPKTNLDWLAIFSLWVGAGVMAIKAGDISLIAGAPTWLASNGWSYVPAALISFYFLFAIIKGFKGRSAPKPAADLTQSAEPSLGDDDLSRDVLKRHRTLIDGGRRIVSEYNRKADHQNVIEFLHAKPEYLALRHLMDQNVVKDIENSRLLVVSPAGPKDGKLLRFMDELTRLENKWHVA